MNAASSRVCAKVFLAIAILVLTCFPARWSASGQIGVAPVSLAVPARNWAAEACNNEIALIDHPNMYLRYRMHVIDEKGNQTRDVIETNNGTVARLILRDDRVLTDEENKAEIERLNDLLASPAAYEKHIANEATEKKRAIDLIRMLPEAMTFTYAPDQPQRDGSSGRQVVLDFRPNPAWRPPNLASEALTGLQGRAWIDARTHRMIRMEVEIFQAVNFGWGMLAHVYPGGHFALTQRQLDDERWIVSNFSCKLMLKALMVKTIHQNVDVATSAYQAVGSMNYQDAIHALLATPLPK